MNEGPILVNEFTGGVASDFDPDKIGNKTMTYSLNGRVIFNQAGTLGWANGRGNKLAINLGFNYGASNNYKIIGGIEISGYLVLFSTQNNYTNLTTNPPNQGHSEIGILTENQPGVYVYQTVFNDQYDPNGQLMHLNSRYQIKAQAVFENKDIIRIYWCDDYNEDRVFNIVAGAKPYTNPITGVTYFTNPYTHPYPYWYSVHGMSELADVQFGLIKYQKNIPGSKIAGVRQYFYRLVHMSGYATPWSIGSGMIFVTVPEVNITDWTQYTMVNSGTKTSKGHQLEIKYIDQRFTFIEVAWAYYSTDKVPQSAAIFFQGLITGPSMIVSDINEDVVTPIPDPTILIQRYTDVIHSKTKLINENYHHKANVVLRPTIEINTADITIEPIIRLMASDVLQDVSTTPITNGLTTTNDFVSVELFENGNGTPFNEDYILGDNVPNGSVDYINYKGTQWDCLFKGEFRDQTVPFAIVLFSRKGQPFFAQHIGDFTMPQQYGKTWENVKLSSTGVPIVLSGTSRNNGVAAIEGDYTLTNYYPNSLVQITNNIQQPNQPVLNILGKLVSGIDLTDVLYDQYGNLQISGFSIVRADRVPNLVAQGLVLNVSNISGTNTPLLGDGNFIGPLHSTGNAYFQINGAGVSGGQTSFRNTHIDHGGLGAASSIIGNYFTLELPDNLIDPTTIQADQQTGYILQLVGNVQGSYIGAYTVEDPCLPLPVFGVRPTQLTYTSFYTKNYATGMKNLTKSNQTGAGTGKLPLGTSPTIGDFSSITPIEKLWTPAVATLGETTSIDNFKYSSISFLQQFFFDINCNGIYHGVGPTTQVVIRTPQTTNANPTLVNASMEAFPIAIPNTAVDGDYSVENVITYYLANIITGQPHVLNESIIANRTYKNIGHFVPINPQIVAAATQTSGRVVFNQCEVWGGDCYVDYFGYGRMIPLYATDGHKPTPAFYDYGCGLIFPCETVNNHTMRTGNTFPGVAMKPGVDESIAISANPVFYSGLYENFDDSTDARLEDFSLNAVMQASDAVDTYKTKGIYFVDEPDQPLLEMVSQLKIPGETYDQFRLFKVNNNQPADSQFGWICDLEALGINIYVLQEKGFGRVRFNERTLETTAQANLTVGTGQGYQGHDYLAGADFGCQHEWSVVNNKKAIYWVNAYKGKHNRFAGNGLECLSDVYGQHNYFREFAEQYWQIAPGPLTDTNENIYDNPISVGGIAAVYDYRNRAEINTFTQALVATKNGGTYDIVPNPKVFPSTMEYGDASSHYEGNWSFIPGIYFSYKQDFFSPDPLHVGNFYVHNEGDRGSFYGIIYPSQLEFIAKSPRQFIYDNMEIDTSSLGATAIQSMVGETPNGSQTIILNNPLLDSRPVYRNSALVFPTMAINQSTRIRGSYLDALFTIDNTLNLDVLISEARTFVRRDYR